MHQNTILLVTLVGMACVAFPFAIVARGARQAETAKGWLGPGTQRGLVVGMLLLGAAVTYASLAVWPHRVTATTETQTLNVTGFQWYWEVDKTRIVTGKPVVFNVHTQDVNHGMGIYDADYHLIFQVQAMPGYLNRVQYTFEKPGVYRVLCMEFCGIGHQDMTTEFTVSDERAQGRGQ